MQISIIWVLIPKNKHWAHNFGQCSLWKYSLEIKRKHFIFFKLVSLFKEWPCYDFSIWQWTLRMCYKGRHVRVYFQGKIYLNLQEGGHKSSVYHFSYKWREHEVLHIFMTFVIAVSVWDRGDWGGGTKKEF